MTTYYNWLGPPLHIARYIAADYRFAKDCTTNDITNSTIWRTPHLFESELLNTSLIGCYSSTLDTNIVFLYCFGRINCNLIICSIAMLYTKIVIFYIKIDVRQDKFLLNKRPYNTGHLVSINLYNRIFNFNFLHYIFSFTIYLGICVEVESQNSTSTLNNFNQNLFSFV